MEGGSVWWRDGWSESFCWRDGRKKGVSGGGTYGVRESLTENRMEPCRDKDLEETLHSH